MRIATTFFIVLLFSAFTLKPPKTKLQQKVEDLAEKVNPQLIKWRHHIHQNPELSNREYKTGEYIATYLKSLGLEVQTKVAHTGVVGILKGGKPGPVVALRADMDALPVPERAKLPWASKAIGEYNGQEVPVMHACGHDTHVAMLMGVATVLSQVKSELKGTVKFIFQPAEEGAPAGEEGGAKLMVKEGVLKNPDVDVIFGLHIHAGTHIGELNYRPGGTMASANSFKIVVHGKQSHGSQPWLGIDPIVTAAQIINNAQTIVSRSMPLTEDAAVVSFGSIHGGVRNNIIPETVTMVGTIRALDDNMREEIFRKLKLIATKTAESNEATVDVTINEGAPVTYNNVELTNKMVPTLQSVMGPEHVHLIPAITGAEDFSFFQREVPGFYFFIGGTPLDVAEKDAAPHHTPDFYVDDAGMIYGVKTMSRLVVDYENMK